MLSGPSWMEDMTTSSALLLHAWVWRKLMWRMQYLREIRYTIFMRFFIRLFVFFVKTNRCGRICYLRRNYCHSFIVVISIFYLSRQGQGISTSFKSWVALSVCVHLQLELKWLHNVSHFGRLLCLNALKVFLPSSTD